MHSYNRSRKSWRVGLVTKETILWVATGAIVYVVSLILLAYYTESDQIYYTMFYEALGGRSIFEAHILQGSITGSAEPVFTGIMWVGAQLGISHKVYVSLLNTVLAISMIGSLRKWGVPLLMIVLLLFNYYFLVLMTGAERLKISYILLFMGLLTTSRIRFIFFALAPLSHFQTLINYISIASSMLPAIRFRRYVSVRWFVPALIMGIVVSAMAIVLITQFGGSIVSKGNAYAGKPRELQVFIPGVGITIIGFLVVRRRARFLFMMTSLLLMVIVLGGTRVNMILFVMFFYAVVTDGRVRNPLVYVPLLYLAAKSIKYIENILVYGHGFA